MMTRDDLIKIAGSVVVLLLLTLLQNKVNTKRNHRGRQALLPFAAAVWSVVGTVLICVKYDDLQALWQKITEKLAWLQPTSPVGEFVLGAGILALNILLMLGFTLLKCVLCPVLSRIWKDQRLMAATSSSFYDYDELYSEWFLQNRWADFRGIVIGFAVSVSVLSGIMLSMTWINGYDAQSWLLGFPCAALIVINELLGFINGLTKEEFLHNVLGDEADARRVGSFFRIREIYEKLFAPQMLAAHTGCEFSSRQGPTTLLETFKESEDPVERNVAKYYLTYDPNVSFDPDGIQATSLLLHGKSVVFFNPFYRDMGDYLTLPIIDTLLRGKKCLVIAGRTSTSRDAVEWLTDILRGYSHLRTMWRVKELTANEPACEVGVLNFQHLYDVDVLSANRDFICDAEFVLLLEPSVMLSTGQVGLSIIAEEANRYDDPPVYCICDRYTDGLVDTISHVLHTEIVNALATPVPRCIYTGMSWNSDGDFIRQKLFDKQTRFLGNGVELAAAAIKNQVPVVTWYGETKAPLLDIKWIAGQHHATICRYMNQPTQQSSLYEKIRFMPSLWTTRSEKEQFILVEDEFCNMFNMLRAFLSRGDSQAFVNVLSENYLLRDYMRCNQQMFLSNPNAIPSLAPDYAKTERNTLLKLLILMAVRPVAEQDAAEELRLAGCVVEDAFDTLSRLLAKYTFTDGSIFEIRATNENSEAPAVKTVNYFSIPHRVFDEHFANSLKTAYYIVEDEKRETEFIGAKLFGHVTQTILPGQFVVYDGKYYEVRAISPENGIILRRAADLYTGRRHYRQIRTYRFDSPADSNVVYSRKAYGMEMVISTCDFSVLTTGYLDMGDSSDLRMAKVITFEDDPLVHNYDRVYRNKNVLHLTLPDSDDKIRFTVCLLLSEVFRSEFPDAWQYLAVLTKRPDDIDGILNHVVYSVEGGIDENEIYIVEDSALDLGLLDTVVRSLPQMLELLADFLDWHFEKMREPESKDPIPVQTRMKPEDEKRRNLFLRMADRIKKLFGGKAEKVEIPRVESAEEPDEDELPAQEGAEDEATVEEGAYSLDAAEEDGKVPAAVLPKDAGAGGEFSFSDDAGQRSAATGPAGAPAPDNDVPDHPEDELLLDDENADADLVHIDGTDIFENEGVPEDDLWLEESLNAIRIAPIRKTRYQKECYLKFGFEEIDGRLRIEDVRKYFRVRGFSNNSLTQARTREAMDMTELDFDAVNFCDFCGIPLSGVSYERMNDGRIRCNDCSASAITTVDEFKAIFFRVLELLEMFYGINIHIPISIKMADARAIAKGAGYVFKPSVQYASRVLGYAQRRHGRYSILIENGSPRLATIDTMVHELTHIWQYLNWNNALVQTVCAMNDPVCTKRARDILYEGMAMWASVQYLYQIGETYYAAQQEAQARARNDIYGIGFKLYTEQYPLVKDMSLIKYSPFASFPPLEPETVKAASKSLCTRKDCVC